MTAVVRVALILLVLVLLAGAGAWYFFFAPAQIDAARVVPGDTLLFATIPNGAHVGLDYQSSHLKQLLDAPEAQPAIEFLRGVAGNKVLTLLQSLAPDLSGESFLAVTRFTPGDLTGTGLIAGMRPKPGFDNFDAFVAQVNQLYPGLAGQTGTAQVEGLDYRWAQPPGAPDKICVARYRGWIVTAWGEATLQDWWERMENKASSPSLAENPAYQKSRLRTGADAEGFLYVAHPGAFRPELPGADAASAFAVATSFVQGDITDRYSLLLPRSAQAETGLAATPCGFDTLKFTGPDTRLYWAGNFNWAQVWKNLEANAAAASPPFPLLAQLTTDLQGWAQAHSIDIDKNIIGALGDEASVQVEWGDDSSYPDAGLFLKLDQPDAFKPVVAALIDTVRQAYSTVAVINELNSNGQNFATLKFVAPLPISPTVTEDGPYFGLFVSETHAVRAFQRDISMGLQQNADFTGRLGDRRTGATQLAYLDFPRLADRSYQTALPYLSMAALFSRGLQGQNLPADLHWLAPAGTWGASISSDDDGLTGYSISGVGNQGGLMLAVLRDAFRRFPDLGPMLTRWITPPPTQAAPPPVATPPANPTVPAATNAAPVPAPAPAPAETNAAAPAAPSFPSNAPPSAPSTNP